MLEAITRTLISLNAVYGRGDVLGVVMESDWKSGSLTFKIICGQPETRRFRFDLAKNTVFFAGHQKKIA